MAGEHSSGSKWRGHTQGLGETCQCQGNGAGGEGQGQAGGRTQLPTPDTLPLCYVGVSKQLSIKFLKQHMCTYTHSILIPSA